MQADEGRQKNCWLLLLTDMKDVNKRLQNSLVVDQLLFV